MFLVASLVLLRVSLIFFGFQSLWFSTSGSLDSGVTVIPSRRLMPPTPTVAAALGLALAGAVASSF